MTPGADRVRPRWAEGWSDDSTEPAGARGAVYWVIVHAAGQLDDDQTAGYWTEVPALAACASDGQTLEEAISSTRGAISAWLALRGGSQAREEVRVRVELAY